MKQVSQGISDQELTDLVKSDKPLIVECGAHDGRDTERFLRLFPEGRVVAFEPDPRPLLRENPPGFYKRIRNHPRVTLVQAAVSDKCGVATLYRSTGQVKGWTDYDHSNSLQEPTGHLEVHPWCKFPVDKQIRVLTTTLDCWLGQCGQIDLLWADVQGGQKALLRGAANTLDKVRNLYVECHERPLYENEPTQEELITKLKLVSLLPRCLYEGYNFLFCRELEGHE